MDIITIFNYYGASVGTHAARMLLAWANQALEAKRFSGGAIKNVRIISTPNGIHPTLRHQMGVLFGERIIYETVFNPAEPEEDMKAIEPNYGRLWQLVFFKLDVICSQTNPYIFIDADAIIITPERIIDLVVASNDKPLILINHQAITDYTAHLPYKFANTGVIIVSNPAFIPPSDVIRKTNISVNCPGKDTDQQLIYNYCVNIGYDYTHPSVGYGWNACGKFKKKSGDGASLVSDGIFDDPHPINILHYWNGFKPWCYECETYENIVTGVEKRLAGDFANTEILNKDDVIINCSVVDGSDSFHNKFPLGMSWQFAGLSETEQNEFLQPPRIPLSLRKNLCLVSINTETDLNNKRNSDRKTIVDVLASNGMMKNMYPLKIRDFLEILKNSTFVVSPEGNGVDCHRHYETFAAGAIPIIERNKLMEVKYASLPVLWTYDYSEITPEYLSCRLVEFRAAALEGRFDFSRLKKSFYDTEEIKEIDDMSNFWIRRFIP